MTPVDPTELPLLRRLVGSLATLLLVATNQAEVAPQPLQAISLISQEAAQLEHLATMARHRAAQRPTTCKLLVAAPQATKLAPRVAGALPIDHRLWANLQATLLVGSVATQPTAQLSTISVSQTPLTHQVVHLAKVDSLRDELELPGQLQVSSNTIQRVM